MNMEFWEYLKIKYSKWRGDAYGRDKSQKQWADEIGVPQPTLSRWMQKGGPLPTDIDSIIKLAEYFGPEIFEVLGIDSGAFGTNYLPEDMRKHFERAVRETSQALADNGLSVGDPAAEQLAIKIFERNGFKYKQTKKLP